MGLPIQFKNQQESVKLSFVVGRESDQRRALDRRLMGGPEGSGAKGASAREESERMLGPLVDTEF